MKSKDCDSLPQLLDILISRRRIPQFHFGSVLPDSQHCSPVRNYSIAVGLEIAKLRYTTSTQLRPMASLFTLLSSAIFRLRHPVMKLYTALGVKSRTLFSTQEMPASIAGVRTNGSTYRKAGKVNNPESLHFSPVFNRKMAQSYCSIVPSLFARVTTRWMICG